MGNLEKAKIILLALNPGVKVLKDDPTFSCQELKWYDKHKEKVKSILNSNLTGTIKDFPYYYLNPDIKEESPGHRWLEMRVRQLLAKTGLTNKELSDKIACIQYFPYHSIGFTEIGNQYLPSQEHNFELVKLAIKKEKLIICMRSKSKWEKALGEGIFKNKDKFIELKNPRSTYLTKKDEKYKGNMEEKDFEKILDALK